MTAAAPTPLLRLLAAILLLVVPAQLPSQRGAAPAPAAAATAELQAVNRRVAAAKAAMMASPDRSLSEALAAARLAEALPPSRDRTVALATARWLEGGALLRLNQPARAAPVLARALGDAERSARGTELHAELLRSSGSAAATLGRVQQALADFQAAHRIFQAIGNERGQAMALVNIGSIYNDAGDWERVLSYLARAADIYTADPSLTLAARNNRGNALRELGRFAEAEAEYRLAFAAAQKLGSPLLEARILTNLASAQELSGRLDEAQASIARGLRIAADARAADWRPFLWGVGAEIAFKRGDLADAQRLIGRTFDGVDLDRTTMPYREFHDFAHRLYAKAGDKTLALAHLEAFKRLDDESRAVAASTNAALMAARFDFATQDLRIAKLKTGQLERDMQLAAQRARLHRIVTVGLISTAAVIFALLLYGYFRIRRSRDQVRAANRELSTTNVQLEKALKAKTDFLATTSHEIRTPLNGILGMTQVILHDEAVTGPMRERLEVVHGAGETMKALVDDLLDVAKMETGKLVIDRTEIDLGEVLTAVMRLWGGTAKGKNLGLALDAESGLGRIVEDETRLRQILFNLLSNAIKFTERGGVRLAVSTGEEDRAEVLRLQVQDTGIGIPEEQLERIFEPFHQVDGGVTRKYGGTGLGLAICRNLADAMGGRIEVESELGRGSTFTVTLPLTRVRPAAAAEPGAAPAAAGTLAAARLLLVERNPLAQSIVRAVLEGEVAAFEIAEDGDAAIGRLADTQFDELLVEAASATVDGFDRIASIAALRAAAPDASLTVLWPDPSDSDRTALAAVGATQVLAKPIAAKAIVEALKARQRVGDQPDLSPTQQRSAA